MGLIKIIKIVSLNLGIAVVNTLIFSPGLLGFSLDGTSTFETAFGATAIIMSVIVFIYANHRILLVNKKTSESDDMNTAEDFINDLKRSKCKSVFENDISALLEQIERFQRKKETIMDVLQQQFDFSEMSYEKFDGAIRGVEKIFYLNIKSILNKLSAFDEKDYKRTKKEGVQKKKFTSELLDTKLAIYHEYIAFVKDAVEDNEQILLKLDKILLEISKLNSLEDGELEDMAELKEFDELISKTKLYR